jgi:hypothetical protein
MVDDAWLVQKQTKYLQDIIALREVSIQLLDCLSALTQAVTAQIDKEALRHENINHLAHRAGELLKQSLEMTGIVSSPNALLQQEFQGLPNVDVTLPAHR